LLEPAELGRNRADLAKALKELRQRLRSHRQRWWWPVRCQCGSRHPCGARLLALDERRREMCRAAVEWYPRYFAERARRSDRE
jgi:hypothetical protein